MTSNDYLISIDPGVRACSCVYWYKGRLLRAKYIRPANKPFSFAVVSFAVVSWLNERSSDYKCLQPLLVVEKPQTYRGRAVKGDTNDLINLSIVIGQVTSFDSLRLATSREWKGNTPKHVTKSRVDQELSDEEKARIEWPAPSLRHNLYDAIGIGLWYLKKHGIRKAI